MLSLKYNFLFIHVHKAGGNSIQSALWNYSEDYQEDLSHSHKTQDFEVKNSRFPSLRKHSTLQDYQQLLDQKTFAALYKFACVRNPWERMMSFYFSPHRLGVPWSREEFLKLFDIVPSALSMLRKLESVNSPFLKPDVDFIIRFETLQQDFAKVCDHLGLSQITLPHKNHRTVSNYLQYYDDELNHLIEDRFSDDIQAFGYKNPFLQ